MAVPDVGITAVAPAESYFASSGSSGSILSGGSLSPYISAGGSILSTILSALYNYYAARRSEQWARQDATTAYNRQVDFWNMQNAYNTPAAQMKRYMDAGLNPNLIYGQQQGAIAPASVPQAASASVSPIQADLGLGSFQEYELMKAQIDRLRTQNENDTKLSEGQLEKMASEVGLNLRTMRKVDGEAALLKADEAYRVQELMNLKEDYRIKMYERQVKQKTWEKEVQRFADECKITHAEAAYAMQYFNARLLNLQAQTGLYSSQSQLADAERNKIERTIEYVVDIMKSSKTIEDCRAKMAEFAKGHTNNWEYWLDKGVNIFSTLVSAAASASVAGFL